MSCPVKNCFGYFHLNYSPLQTALIHFQWCFKRKHLRLQNRLYDSMLCIRKLVWKTLSIMTDIKTIALAHYSILMAIKTDRVLSKYWVTEYSGWWVLKVKSVFSMWLYGAYLLSQMFSVYWNIYLHWWCKWAQMWLSEFKCTATWCWAVWDTPAVAHCYWEWKKATKSRYASFLYMCSGHFM